MIRGRLKRTQEFLTVALLCLPLASFAFAAYLRFATRLLPYYSSDADPSAYFGLLLVTTIIWAVMTEKYDLISVEKHIFASGKVRKTVLACLTTYVAVLAITFFYRQSSFSRVFMWISALTLLTLSLLFQALLYWNWNRKRAGYKWDGSVLIVGADDFAVRIADSLRTSSVTRCLVKGHVRLAGQASAVTACQVYELSDIQKLAIGNGFDDVIIAIPPILLSELPALRTQLSPLCVPLRLVLDVGEATQSSQRLFRLGDLLLVDLKSTAAESAIYVILKRAFDLIFAAGVLLFTAPLLALIAFAVRVSSPGPVIFGQDRVGLNGKLFRMYKFRSMRVSSPQESDTRWTVKGDPRCTRLGAILRRSGLDELPQFFNVLRGEMSVVGPRPERPILVQKFMQSVGNYNTRHYLKVGITGWAQVNGWRGDTSIEKRVEYDLYYVRHWTLTFDLFIVLLTFLRGFTNKNAY
ncbi:MAG: exopolysaccharide biosynthesis polyprenyl glycosylphosphotransferase [Candidatus Acidiferrum sp.]|jgi:Undecaprenyl-phosphate glucose phosphotransferase